MAQEPRRKGSIMRDQTKASGGAAGNIGSFSSGPTQSPLSPKMRSLSVAGSAEPMCGEPDTYIPPAHASGTTLFCEKALGHRGKHRHGRATW